MHPNTETIDLLLRQFDGQVLIPFAEASAAMGMAEQTARNRLRKGDYPVKTLWNGTRRLVHVADLAEYIDDLRTGSKAPRKRGRPRKTASGSR